MKLRDTRARRRILASMTNRELPADERYEVLATGVTWGEAAENMTSGAQRTPS